MKVVFRADASLQIGSGHIMRCLALAQTLRRQGHAVSFISRTLPGHRLPQVAAQGFGAYALPAAPAVAGSEPDSGLAHAAWLGVAQSVDAEQSHALLAELRPDWLIVDHYALDYRWQQRQRDVVGRILVIDDLGDRRHDCDLLLDQNESPAVHARYPALLPAGCPLLLGQRYGLLRQEFAQARQALPARSGELRHVLVGFGGFDAGNASALALAALRQGPASIRRITLLLGQQSPHAAALAEQYADWPALRIVNASGCVAELMAEADLMIGAGGGMVWERCCLGLPGIALSTAANQEAQLQALAEQGACWYLGPQATVTVDSIAHLLHSLAQTPYWLRHASQQAAAISDGQGCSRVLRALQPVAFSWRPVTADDADLLYRWRSDEDVRRWSLHGQAFDYASHCRWLHASLLNPQRVLLLASVDEQPVGSVRYDLSGDSALISVYLAPQRLHQGLGRQLLQSSAQWLQQHHPQIKAIDAEILPDNAVSIAAFTAAGYRPHRLHYQLPLGTDHG